MRLLYYYFASETSVPSESGDTYAQIKQCLQVKTGQKKTTWSHKNTYLSALSVQHHFMYLTARFAAVSKRNVP